MIRSELAKLLSDDNPGLSARDIELIMTTVFDRIINQLADGGRVELRGFGAFSTRARGVRVGRNPRTGDKVMNVSIFSLKSKSGMGNPLTQNQISVTT